MKLYDTVRELLRKNPSLRNSDKALIWRIWEKEGLIVNGFITYEKFEKGATPSSIARARRKVQEHHPELQAVDEVKKKRQEIADQKGTHVYRDKLFE